MNNIPDAGQTAPTGEGGAFAPQDAAAVLEQASRQARRRLEPFPPQMSLIRALIALVTYGTVWLSVRGQHPYKGPVAADLAVILPLAAINVGAAVVLARRASAGVRGRTPLRPAEVALAAAAWIGVFVAMAVMASDGVSDSVVYGRYLVAAPLIAGGVTWAAIMVTHANRVAVGEGLVVAAIGAVSLLGGPVGAWPIAAAGLCAALLVRAALVFRRQHAVTVQP